MLSISSIGDTWYIAIGPVAWMVPVHMTFDLGNDYHAHCNLTAGFEVITRLPWRKPTVYPSFSA